MSVNSICTLVFLTLLRYSNKSKSDVPCGGGSFQGRRSEQVFQPVYFTVEGLPALFLYAVERCYGRLYVGVAAPVDDVGLLRRPDGDAVLHRNGDGAQDVRVGAVAAVQRVMVFVTTVYAYREEGQVFKSLHCQFFLFHCSAFYGFSIMRMMSCILPDRVPRGTAWSRGVFSCSSRRISVSASLARMSAVAA